MNTWVPSRKWFAQVIGMAGALFMMWATTGSWDQEETVALITLAVTALTTYILPNAEPPQNFPPPIAK